MVVVIIRYLQIRAIILDPTFMQMLSHFYGNFAAAADGLPPPQDSSQEVTVPAYRLRNSQGNRKLFNQVNQLLFWAGIAIACSCMATGAFRFAETFIWHNSAALGVFMLTPVYMAGNTYLSALWCNAVNSVTVYRYRYWITIATCLLVGAFTATILVLCKLFVDVCCSCCAVLSLTLMNPPRRRPLPRLLPEPDDAALLVLQQRRLPAAHLQLRHRVALPPLHRPLCVHLRGGLLPAGLLRHAADLSVLRRSPKTKPGQSFGFYRFGWFGVW